MTSAGPATRPPWLCGLLVALAGTGRAAGPADGPLRSPPAERIPVAEMRPAVEGALAAGVASVVARILAEGNDTGLAYPPAMKGKVIGKKSIPARRITVQQPIYEAEYAQVEQLVPETSAGQPTGGFVRRKVNVVVRRKLVGTENRSRLVPDPNGTETVEVNEYGSGGPDVYSGNAFGLNAMALYVLIRAGHPHHEAAERLAQSLADKLSAYGIPDTTFDVAWLAAAFTALGKDSRHAPWATELVSKLIDGQIREQAAPRGLWGPVCIHYPYFAKLFVMQGQLRQQLEVELPKVLERAAPQQAQALVAQGKKLRQAYLEFVKAYRAASSQGTRMTDITRQWLADPQTWLPGLPYFIYDRVIADVESTAVALFALAEAGKAGMLPAESDRVAIRGRKVHPPEKTAATLELAARALGTAITEDGGCRSLTLQSVNTGFDKSGLPIPKLPNAGTWPPLFDLETAVTCANGFVAIDSLTAASAKAAEPVAARREAARDRVLGLASRWYHEAAAGSATRWNEPFDTLKISFGDLATSAVLPTPEAEPVPVDELPWGGRNAQFAVLPAFARACADVPSASLLEQPLYRQLAYRLVGLQDANGQWTAPPGGFSSAAAALAMAQQAEAWHGRFQATAPPDPQSVTSYSQLMKASWASNDDSQGFATLASLLFLLPAVDGPVQLAGVPILPEPAAAAESEVPAKQPAPLPPATAAARGAERPNAARAAVFEAVLAAAKGTPAEAPAAAAAAAQEPQEDDSYGKVEDLLEPEP